MKLCDSTYDILKFIGTKILPALSVLVLALFKVWMPDSELGTMISATIMAIDVFINTLIGESTTEYYKAQTTEGQDSE